MKLRTIAFAILFLWHAQGILGSVDDPLATALGCDYAISCNQTITSTLEAQTSCLDAASRWYQWYRFNGSTDQLIKITLKSAGYPGELVLYDPLSTKAAEALNNAALETVSLSKTLTSSGNWQIYVRAKDVYGEGPFSLALQCSTQGGGGGPEDPDPAPFNVTVSPSSVELPIGGEGSANVTVRPTVGSPNVTLSVEAPSAIVAQLDNTAAPGAFLDTLLKVRAPTGTLPGTYYITVVARDTAGRTTSAQLTVRIGVNCSPPKVLALAGPKTVAFGRTATITAAITGSAVLNYQWFRGSAGSEIFPITGATSHVLETPPIMSRSQFWVKVSNGCGTTRSTTFTVDAVAAQGRRRLVFRP